MRRAGGWILGFCVVAATAGGGWLGFRRILNRETLTISYSRGGRDPSTDAMLNGARFALSEVGSRAGDFRIALAAETSLEATDARMRLEMENTFLISGSVTVLESRYHVRSPGLIQILSSRTEQGRAAAAWAVETGACRVLLLSDVESPNSEEVALGFAAAAQDLNLPVLTRINAAGDRARLLDQALGLRPDFIFYSGEEAPYIRAYEIFNALRKKGYTGRLVMGEAEPEVSFLAVPTRLVEGCFLVSPIGLPSPQFAAAYEPATGRHAGPHAWPGYLTMKAMLQVIEKAGSRSTDDLRQAVRDIAPQPRPCALYIARDGKFAFLQDLK